jgi:hypothetical protein
MRDDSCWIVKEKHTHKAFRMEEKMESLLAIVWIPMAAIAVLVLSVSGMTATVIWMMNHRVREKAGRNVVARMRPDTATGAQFTGLDLPLLAVHVDRVGLKGRRPDERFDRGNGSESPPHLRNP